MSRSKRSARPLGYTKVVQSLRALGDPGRAVVQRTFFKDPGNELFLGVTTPALRKLARDFYLLPLSHVCRLMASGVHDERSLALAILRRRYEKGSETEKAQVFKFIFRNRRFVRSWDAVDDSAPNIIGPYLFDRDKRPLYELARSSRLWDRRMAIVATLPYIRQGNFREALKLAEMLLGDEEDLVHKATGWMLREVGKKDLRVLKRFLKAHHAGMSRTTLRYAIERFPEAERRRYLTKGN